MWACACPATAVTRTPFWPVSYTHLSACHDQIPALRQHVQRLPVLGCVAGMIDFHAIDPPFAGQFFRQLHALVHTRLSQNSHAARFMNQIQHFLQRLIRGVVKHFSPAAKQLTVRCV